jgi:Amt family ammonium transporter
VSEKNFIHLLSRLKPSSKNIAMASGHPANISQAVAPSWLNNGDNAWQLTAASLVGLQSVPGLVVLYAGIVKKKWAVNSAFMAFYAFAAVLICWVVFAYEASFGDQMLPFVGVPKPVLVMNDELRQAILPTSNTKPAFPLSTMGKPFPLVFWFLTQC